MSRTSISRVVLLLVQRGLAIPTATLHTRNTTLNETQGDYEPAWVSGPKSRGTLSLVFSCVITLFLCVWTTVQVNIEPPENESIRKLGWSFVALVVPEGVMAIAAYERKVASLLRKKVNEVTPKGPEQWDMFLAYYAIMGGFVIRKEDYDSFPSKAPTRSIQSTRDNNLITITSTQVQDKSNANSLTKLIVAWQALWMIVQVIGRRAQYPDIPVTLLELHTCLHAFCAFAMYITWWNKPVDIDLPTTVHLTPEQIIFLRKGESEEPDPTNPWGRETISSHKTHNHDTSRVFLTSRSGIGKLMYQRLVGHRNIRTQLFWKESLSISFVGLVFGGVHLAAWNSSFPSYAERVLWQISSTITATTWSGFVLSLWLSVFVEKKQESKIVSKVCGIFLGLGLFPVLIVRVYLLVESFISIRRLPIGSYRLNTWSNIWPHAG
ncbi:hypothetical protein CC78DRAFT_593600 [Lojkania enalia]|uniref:Uncharacterized protein n=1 Tax=Lojkania enalia TaxID=147567 RepID=A0A9P4MY40_9PLEO|nr:hypothetical protein CC78DRAFT_593600 [Didymosphaeria enalia]